MVHLETITCPHCQRAAVPAFRLGPLAVCASCGHSLVIAPNGAVSRATALDTEVLTPSELAQLTKARSAVIRGERRPR